LCILVVLWLLQQDTVYQWIAQLFTNAQRVSINTILSFDEKNIFNFSNNNSANGIVQNQQVNSKDGYLKVIENLEKENKYLKGLVDNLVAK